MITTIYDLLSFCHYIIFNIQSLWIQIKKKKLFFQYTEIYLQNALSWIERKESPPICIYSEKSPFGQFSALMEQKKILSWIELFLFFKFFFRFISYFSVSLSKIAKRRFLYIREESADGQGNCEISCKTGFRSSWRVRVVE